MLTFLSLSAREIARGDVFPEITHEMQLLSNYFHAEVQEKKIVSAQNYSQMAGVQVFKC